MLKDNNNNTAGCVTKHTCHPSHHLAQAHQSQEQQLEVVLVVQVLLRGLHSWQ